MSQPLESVRFWVAEPHVGGVVDGKTTGYAFPGLWESGKLQGSGRCDSWLRAACRNSLLGFKFAFQALLQSRAEREPGLGIGGTAVNPLSFLTSFLLPPSLCGRTGSAVRRRELRRSPELPLFPGEPST